MKTLEKICKVLDTIASAVTVALLVFLTILITYSVISRFIFNTPVAWQYEATLVCLSWVVFIGMSVTFRNDEHMRLTFVSNAMPEKIRNIWLCISTDLPDGRGIPEPFRYSQRDAHTVPDDPRQQGTVLHAFPDRLLLISLPYREYQPEEAEWSGCQCG